jgi:hypothetical protein
MVYAIDRDLLSFPVSRVIDLFLEDAEKCKSIYTDPSDRSLYISDVESMNPVEFFTDYTLCYAKMHVISGIVSYGNYDKAIMNYENN